MEGYLCGEDFSVSSVKSLSFNFINKNPLSLVFGGFAERKINLFELYFYHLYPPNLYPEQTGPIIILR